MGRYYWGDIEGKLWLGVQSSDDADFFGGEHSEPNYISYHFSKDDLTDVEQGIKQCLAALGECKTRLDEYFANSTGYTDKLLAKHLSVDENRIRELLVWYARHELGKKIHKCLVENGECSFEAET